MTTTHKAHSSYSATYRPAIDYLDAQRAYYIYNATIQSVRHCPASTFKHAVQQALDGKKIRDDCRELMKSDKLQMVDRWYLINMLEELKTPLKLYSNFDSADEAYYKSLHNIK